MGYIPRIFSPGFATDVVVTYNVLIFIAFFDQYVVFKKITCFVYVGASYTKGSEKPDCSLLIYMI